MRHSTLMLIRSLAKHNCSSNPISCRFRSSIPDLRRITSVGKRLSNSPAGEGHQTASMPVFVASCVMKGLQPAPPCSTVSGIQSDSLLMFRGGEKFLQSHWSSASDSVLLPFIEHSSILDQAFCTAPGRQNDRRATLRL